MCKLKFIFCAVIISVISSTYQSYVSAESPKRVKKAVQMYTTKYDNIDVDSILTSVRLLRSYVSCLLEKGPCTQEGKTLKEYLPDAISTGCTKCNEAQKKIAGKILSELLLKHREEWDKLTAKYDPDGTFRKKYFDYEEDYSDLEEA